MSLARYAAKYRIYGHRYERDRYAAPHMQAYQKTRSDTIITSIQRLGHQNGARRIVEVGCGTGIVLRDLAAAFPDWEIIGIDASRTMLDQARRRTAALPNVRLVVGSADAVPLPDSSVDAIVAVRFMHLFRPSGRKRLVGEFRRLLRDGGMLLLEFYNRPVHMLRYILLMLCMRRPPSTYQHHYPTRREIVSLLGGEVRFVPVRAAGSRLWHALGGDKGVQMWLETCRTVPGGWLFVDEYIAVSGQHNGSGEAGTARPTVR